MNRGSSSPSAAANYLLCTNCRKVLRKPPIHPISDEGSPSFGSWGAPKKQHSALDRVPPVAYEVPGLGVESELQLLPSPQPQKLQI